MKSKRLIFKFWGCLMITLFSSHLSEQEIIHKDISHHFSFPNVGDKYPANATWTTTFVAANDNERLLLTIDFFLTEKDHDYLKIGNGNTTNRNILLKYSGGPSKKAIRVLSEGNTLWMTFFSDRSVTFRGFEGHVNVSQADLTCDDEYISCGNGACALVATDTTRLDCFYAGELRARLTDGENSSTGRLEFLINEKWLGVCRSFWSQYSPGDLCLLLGFETGFNGTVLQSSTNNCYIAYLGECQVDSRAECPADIVPHCENYSQVSLTCLKATSVSIPCPQETIFYNELVLTFPEGVEGRNVQSLQTCGDVSINPDLPLAHRVCRNNSWQDLFFNFCIAAEDVPIEIERIANVTVTKENVEEVATDLALVTTRINQQKVIDFHSIAKSLESIVETNSSSKSATSKVLETVNNLMAVESERLTTGTSIKFIKSLERQMSNFHRNNGNFTQVENNIAIKAVKIDPDVTRNILFCTSIQRDVDKLSDGDIQLINNADESEAGASTSSILIKRNVLEKARKGTTNLSNSTVPISFYLYRVATIFKTKNTLDVADERQLIASHIIGAIFEGSSTTDLTTEAAVVLKFRNTTLNLLRDHEVVIQVKCVFWVIQEETEKGYWSDEGCTTTKDEKLNQTLCTCNHLTSFAVLVGLRRDIPKTIDRVLTMVTWIGSFMSVIGLMACIFLLLLVKNLRSKQIFKIHINLFLTLTAFYTTFLVGDLFTRDPYHCKIIATAVHYFCLATLCWMSVEAVSMYLLFVKYERSDRRRHFLSIACVAAYGLPLVPVVITCVIAKRQVYKYCFIPQGQLLYFGFLLEVLLLVVFNIVTFTAIVRNVIFRQFFTTATQNNKKTEIFGRIQQFVFFWLLLGLSWVFGFLSLLPDWNLFFFEVLFCVFSSLQGFILFIFIFIKNPEVKTALVKTWSAWLSREERRLDTISTTKNV